MRLTRQILEQCPQFVNPLEEREVEIRGKGLQLLDAAVLQSLGDEFDTIDLSENAIARLDNFPTMTRLTTIIAHRNQISKVSKFVGAALQNVHSIAMHSNQLKELSDLDHFAYFPALERLSLIDNPVVAKPNYRAYLISKCPKLKLIDFNRVLDTERVAAKQLFTASTVTTGATAEGEGPMDAATRRRLNREARMQKRSKGLSASLKDTNINGGGAGGPPVPTAEEDKAREDELYAQIDLAADQDELDAIEAEMTLIRKRCAERESRKRQRE